MQQFLIQCVVVLYKQSPRDAQALSSLLDICASDAAIASQIKILVYDNSPQFQGLCLETAGAECGVNIEYSHAVENSGLAYAYNVALSLARARKLPWLLLLDQDTCLTRQFFDELLKMLQDNYPHNVTAFVPKLVHGDLVLSPQVVGKVFYRRMQSSFAGCSSEPLVAFNSAACLRVEDLLAIKGFPEEFWLDYLDHMVFHRLQQSGGKVFVLNSQLEHSLSMADIELNVSTERYANILEAEWMFVQKSGWGGGPKVHRLRLLKRALSHAIKLRNKSYALQVLRSVIS
jgi:GT2 family glycosyltransferase